MIAVFPRVNDRQLEFLSSRARSRWPDAVLDHVQSVEEVVQLIAGGARASRAAAGQLLRDPATWERSLASLLLNDPRLPIALEAVRHPWPRMEQGGASHPLLPLVGTTRITSASETPVVSDGARTGWRILASVERREMPTDFLAKESGPVAYCYQGVEQGISDSKLALLPLTHADARIWFSLPLNLPIQDALVEGPLIGVDGDAARDGVEGLNWPSTLPMAPSVNLVAVLRLRPGKAPMELVDDAGPAMSMGTWRAAYTVSEYELIWPLVSGARVLLRPDLFDRALALGGERMVWREYRDGVVDSPTSQSKASPSG